MGRIERVEARCIGPPVERRTWSHDLPPQFMTCIVVRATTEDGRVGVGAVWNATSFEFDRYTAEATRHLLPVLIGKDPLAREEILREIRPRVFPLPPGAVAAIEVALFDLAGQATGEPLHRLLGATRDRLPAYASPPMLASVPAYLDFVAECLARGFRAIKFHTWCDPARDLELARAVRREHTGAGVEFMLDVENNYTREEAMRAGRELADLGFRWFEAPLPDHDLEGYRALTRELSIPVLPSGNWVRDLSLFREALRTRTWGAARTDVTMMGGVGPALQAGTLARSAGLDCEIMSWGYNLAAAANLHVMLALENCTYFEQAMPYELFEYGMVDAIRLGPDGFVSAPDRPGLGLRVDWEAMEAATFHVVEAPGP
ncbi:MAG: mandelate racemase/muconate lactonizing enzyme family protein [Immundisolibacterales bacterium]|nr:mandelate racemase/muconate lactonizing enzyme family protein [Immundisolibacterales bacterium]